MKYFLICLLIFAVAWVLRLIMSFLVSATTSNLEKRKNAVSGILNVFVSYVFATVVLLSYDLFVPLLFFSLNMYKTFSWIMSLAILASMVYASIGCVALVTDNIATYGFGKGYCIVAAFIINIENVNVVCPAIKSLFETSYKKDISLPFDILTVAVFAFDVILLVYMLKQTKNKTR